MLKLATLATATLVALSSAAHAGHFDTGNDIYSMCAGKDNIACTATASAYLDMMQTVGYKCSTGGVSRTQVKDVLLKFLAENPAQRNYTASSIAVFAYMAAFDCAKPEKQ